MEARGRRWVQLPASSVNVSGSWFGFGNVLVDSINTLFRTVKPGQRITYNGTDSLVLNKCTGLADEVDSAQDTLSLFKALGHTEIVL